MLLNYLKLSLRLLARNPFFTFINVAGLSIGFATFLLLWPYAEFELKSDQYHPGADRIVRLAVDFKWTDNGENWNGFLGAFNSWGVAHKIGETFPQVEAVTRVVDQLNFDNRRQGINRDFFITIIDNKERRLTYRETQTIFAEPDFFQFFAIPLVAGDILHAMDAPNTVVLSEETSKKYFGEEAAVGKTIYLNDSLPVRITGVFKDLPQNTHFRFNLVFSVAGKKGYDIATWNGWAGYCYMKLKRGYDFKKFQHDLDEKKTELYEFVKYGCAHCDWNSFVQPLSEVVFSDLRGNSFHSKSKFLLKGLYAVSFIVLLLAWINYITLSIHSLNKRLSELATRKVVGAGSSEFSMQFLVESITINIISFAAALTLFQLLKSPAEQWLGLYIPRWHELSGKIILIISLIFVAGVLITAFYPLVIIRKRSVSELFKKSKRGIKHSFVNTGLVTVQYVTAIVLLIWIVTSNIQINHILKKNIGIKKSEIIVVEGSPKINQYEDSRITSFLQETKRIKGINESTMSYSLVGEPDVKGLVIQRSTDSNFVGVDTNGGVDENFLKTFQISLLAGRNFLPDNPADKSSILISKALVKRLGFSSPEEALGQRVILPDFRNENVEIIGVISDYEFRPYFSDATEHNRGIALMYKNFLVPYFKPLKLSISLEGSDLKTVLERIETLHQSLFPEETFKWYWLDEKIERQYTNEKKAKNQITFFTLLAISIACLGLFGLISNKAVEKTKEIGIRKVMGAHLHQIAQLLLNTTIRQILIATIFGIPIAYYLTQQYLEKFSERITLQWWHFAVPVLILVLIMLATVATVLYKAARSNPVEALKYE